MKNKVAFAILGYVLVLFIAVYAAFCIFLSNYKYMDGIDWPSVFGMAMIFAPFGSMIALLWLMDWEQKQ